MNPETQKTNNIYTSWLETAGHKIVYRDLWDETAWVMAIRNLDDFTLDELTHLKWLIEQEMESRDAKVNG